MRQGSNLLPYLESPYVRNIPVSTRQPISAFLPLEDPEATVFILGSHCFCFTAAWNQCCAILTLTTPTMIGSFEFKFRRGRRHVRHPSGVSTRTLSPQNYLRSHRRDFGQRLYRCPTQLDVQFDLWKNISCGDLISSTAVKSRNQAKRLLRLCAPLARRPPFTCHSGPSNCLEVPKAGEAMATVDTRRGSARLERPSSLVGGPVSGIIHRPSLAENVRTASRDSMTTNNTGTTFPSGMLGLGEEKPIVSGNGLSLSIALAEPVLFLQGFDQSELGNQNTSMLRGNFRLRVSKSAKIKTITLAFRGRAETEWPEGQFVLRSV